MNLSFQDILALIAAAIAAVFVFRALWRTMSGQGGCGCSGEKKCATSSGERPDFGIKRVPLVTLDQVGKPQTKSRTGDSKENH